MDPVLKVPGGILGGGGGGSPGPTLTTLPVEPTVRYHPGFSTVVESAGRVVSAVDLQGIANATEGGAGIGPFAMTDALGRKFWRFAGAEYLTVAAGIVFAHTRETTVFMVGRIPKVTGTTRIVSGGSVALGTAGNGAQLLDARVALTGEAAFVGNGRQAASNREHVIVGAQLQVMGNLRRNTANGGDAVFLNRKTAVIGTQSSGTAVVAGAEVGRYSYAPGSSGNWGNFDLYELLIFDTKLTVAECESIQEALADNYEIVEIENQLILDGDSITQGTGLVTPALSCAAVMTDPGAGLIPDNWRVCNFGISGGKVVDLVARRDAVNGWSSFGLLTQNVLAFEIGRNDWASGINAATHYSNVVAYLNTTTTGVLNRGWTVRVMANIAGAPIIEAEAIPYRAAIRDPQFLIDTGTNGGGPYAGKLSIVDTDQITVAGQTVFATSTDAANPIYYAGDSTHPTVLGAAVRVNGGDDPTKAIAYGLT